MIQGAPEKNRRVEALNEQLEISRIKWSFIVRANYVNSFLDLAFGISMTCAPFGYWHTWPVSFTLIRATRSGWLTWEHNFYFACCSESGCHLVLFPLVSISHLINRISINFLPENILWAPRWHVGHFVIYARGHKISTSERDIRINKIQCVSASWSTLIFHTKRIVLGGQVGWLLRLKQRFEKESTI